MSSQRFPVGHESLETQKFGRKSLEIKSRKSAKCVSRFSRHIFVKFGKVIGPTFNTKVIVQTFDTKITEYLCSGWILFSSDNF